MASKGKAMTTRQAQLKRSSARLQVRAKIEANRNRIKVLQETNQNLRVKLRNM
jgi:uncharacterized protein YggU (UPF0235/DUF167 family)